MRVRKTRILFSVLFGILTLLLTGLWIASVWTRTDFVVYKGLKWDEHEQQLKGLDCYLGSTHGTLLVDIRMGEGLGKWLELPITSHKARGFGWWTNDYQATLWLPHGFLIMPLAVLTFAPWIRWSTRFSLRTLLIFITFISLALGLIIYFTRA